MTHYVSGVNLVFDYSGTRVWAIIDCVFESRLQAIVTTGGWGTNNVEKHN